MAKRADDRRQDWRRCALPAAAGVAFFAATLLGIDLARLVDNVAVLWIPNGILLAALMRRADRAAALFAAGIVGSFVANLVSGHGIAGSLVLTAGNMAEVGFAAWAIRRWAGPAPLFGRVGGVVRFTLIAGLAAPAIGAAVAAAGLSGLGAGFVDVWSRWVVGDALGLLIVTPTLVILHARLRQGPDALLAARSRLEVAALLSALVGLSLAVFVIPAEVALFLLLPLLLVATFRLGPFGAATGCIIIAAVGVWQTVHGAGPVALFDGSEAQRVLHFQLFLAVLFLSALPVAAALAERQAMATDLAAACDAARRAAESFYDQASTDELTGVATRRRFLERMHDMIAAARVRGSGLALVVIDVDHFKAINDAHGHPAGDAVLRAIADTCRETTRAGDVIGRLGGEEFAVLMPEATRDGAAAVCERLRAAVAARLVDAAPGVAIRATVSLGLVVLHGQDGERALADADRALYQAKRAGRNRLAIAA